MRNGHAKLLAMIKEQQSKLVTVECYGEKTADTFIETMRTDIKQEERYRLVVADGDLLEEPWEEPGVHTIVILCGRTENTSALLVEKALSNIDGLKDATVMLVYFSGFFGLSKLVNRSKMRLTVESGLNDKITVSMSTSVLMRDQYDISSNDEKKLTLSEDDLFSLRSNTRGFFVPVYADNKLKLLGVGNVHSNNIVMITGATGMGKTNFTNLLVDSFKETLGTFGEVYSYSAKQNFESYVYLDSQYSLFRLLEQIDEEILRRHRYNKQVRSSHQVVLDLDETSVFKPVLYVIDEWPTVSACSDPQIISKIKSRLDSIRQHGRLTDVYVIFAIQGSAPNYVRGFENYCGVNILLRQYSNSQSLNKAPLELHEELCSMEYGKAYVRSNAYSGFCDLPIKLK